MSQLSQNIKNLKLDKRLYTLNVKMGEIDPQQHQSYLQSLEDLSAKSKKLYDMSEDHSDSDSLNGDSHDGIN